MLSLGKIREKLPGRHRERTSQLHDILQTNIPFAPLHATDVVSMEAGALCQFLLGESPFLAEPPQCIAESRLNGTWGHSPML
jgi:hypothetical protein